MDLSSYWIRFKSFINESIRVLKVTRKPDKIELLESRFINKTEEDSNRELMSRFIRLSKFSSKNDIKKLVDELKK